MRAVVAQTGVPITDSIFHFDDRSDDLDRDMNVDCFWEWTGLSSSRGSSLVDPRTGLQHKSDSQMGDEIAEGLYEGRRDLLEATMRRGWDRTNKDFKPLPNTAQWSMEYYYTSCSMEGPFPEQWIVDNGWDRDRLCPILKDDQHVYFWAPVTAECAAKTGRFTMPTPHKERDPAMDVWYEEVNDGGFYCLGLDDKVLVFYLDGPGDVIRRRWQCDKERWESMWLKAFGREVVTIF